MNANKIETQPETKSDTRVSGFPLPLKTFKTEKIVSLVRLVFTSRCSGKEPALHRPAEIEPNL